MNENNEYKLIVCGCMTVLVNLQDRRHAVITMICVIFIIIKVCTLMMINITYIIVMTAWRLVS